jgi:hypothetical protein
MLKAISSRWKRIAPLLLMKEAVGLAILAGCAVALVAVLYFPRYNEKCGLDCRGALIAAQSAINESER